MNPLKFIAKMIGKAIFYTIMAILILPFIPFILFGEICM